MFTPLKKPILLISFLRDLKSKDHKAFVFIVICITVQLLLTALKFQATPFFLFGMYSEKFLRSDTFSVMKVLVNDNPIEFYQPQLREKYLVETNTINYVQMLRNNHEDILRTRIEGKYPFFYKSDFYPFFSRRIYNTALAQHHFKTWLKKKALTVIGVQDGVVKIVETTFLLNRTTLSLKPIRHETLEVF